jgi:hypothetical protein
VSSTRNAHESFDARIVEHRFVGLGVDDVGHKVFIVAWALLGYVPPGLAAYREERFAMDRTSAQSLYEELGAALYDTPTGPGNN